MITSLIIPGEILVIEASQLLRAQESCSSGQVSSLRTQDSGRCRFVLLDNSKKQYIIIDLAAFPLENNRSSDIDL